MSSVHKQLLKPIHSGTVWGPLILLVLCFIGLMMLLLIDKSQLEAAKINALTWALGLVSLGLIAWLSFLFYRFSFQRNSQIRSETEQQKAILHLLDEMSTLAEGDLTIRATVTENMTGAIADSVNFAVDALRALVIKIDDTSSRLNNFAQEADNRVSQLSQASARQSKEIGVATSAIATMAQAIQKVSRNAAASTKVAGKSLEISQAGAHTVRNTIQDMVTVREQIQATSKRIKRLGESSQEVGDIVRVMNDIAEQTNILALNASIQTFGNHNAGKGFERVADDVQQLAQRAAEATRKIDVLVRAIQSDTQEVISSMEQTTAKVVASSRNAESARAALDEVEQVSISLARLIANISEASHKQADMSVKVADTMSAIQEVTRQTTQFSQETNKLVSSLNDTAAEMRRSIADFKLSDDDISKKKVNGYRSI